MTVASTECRVQYATDGATASFGYPAVFIDQADIAVDLRDAGGNPVVTTRNGAGANDYTVSGSQDAATGEYLSGAAFVFNAAPASGTLTLFRDPPPTQSLALVTGGKFAAQPVNTEFDRLTMLVQALADRAGRSLTAPVNEPLAPAPALTLPSRSARALGYLGCDADGNLTLFPAPGGTVTVSGLPNGVLHKAIAGDTVLSAAEALNLGYVITGTLGADRNLTWPAYQGALWVSNNASDDYSLQCGLASRKVRIRAGDAAWIRSDGVDFFSLAEGDTLRSTDFNVPPTGNGFTAATARSLSVVTDKPTQCEFVDQVNVLSNIGDGQDFTHGSKVASFVGLVQAPGSGPAFTQNIVLDIEAGVSAPDGGFNVAIATEIDFNNFNQHYNDTTIDGAVQPYGAAFYITGFGGTFRAGAAQVVNLGLGSFPANRGISMFNGNFRLNGIEMLAGAGGSGAYFGGSYAYALDLAPATCATGALLLPNNTWINARNAGNTADLAALKLDPSNALILGTSGVTAVAAGQQLIPVTDNALTLGKAGARWSAVWAVNGTIQTSDPRLKTDIADLPAALPIVLAIQPRTFKWISGGQVEETYEALEDVPLTETVIHRVAATEIVAGEHRRVWRQVAQEVAVVDQVPVVAPPGMAAGPDELIDPVTRQLYRIDPGRPEICDRSDAVVRPARLPGLVAQTHPVQRTERRTVTKTRWVDRPGLRTHWGFLAPEVKAAIDAHAGGRDFGGYILGADGIEGLRIEELVPILWQAVIELTAEVRTLKAPQP